jgi:hypothetical protein
MHQAVDSLMSKLLEGLLVLGDQALASSTNVSKINTPSGLTGNATVSIKCDIQKQNKIIEDGHTTMKAEQVVETSRTKDLLMVFEKSC